MNKIAKFFVSAAFAMVLSSCATTKLNKVYVTNSVRLELLPTSAIKDTIDAYQMFEGDFGENSFSALLYLTADSDGIQVVLLNELGIEMGTMVYDGGTCELNSAMFPKNLKAEYIILDLQNVYADLNELKIHYRNKKLLFEEKTDGEVTKRFVYSKGQLIEEITFEKDTVEIKNHLRGYCYKLTSEN